MTAGPAPHRAHALHRLEHALFALALGAAIAYVVAARGWTDAWRVAFWAIAPDLVFIPIGLAAAGRGGAWPAWGVALYNATHTYVVLVPVAFLASLLQGHVVWPLLGWAWHLEVDRMIGFDLRTRAAALG